MINRANQYIAVDNPNVPLLSCAESKIPCGHLVNSPTKNQNRFETSIGSVQSRDMYLPNFSLRVTEGKFSQDAVLINQDGEGAHLLGTCLILKGNFRSLLPRQSRYVESYARSQNFKYDPNSEYLHAISAHDPFHIIHVSFAAGHFTQFLPENEPWADSLKTKIETKERILGDQYTPLTLAQERALQNIFNCPLSGKLGIMMMETSIMQIIICQLYSLFSKGEQAIPQGLTKQDIEAIREVKEHLTKTFLEDHSLTCLAKHFGINTNKLMMLFKKFFGKSIFEYISELRMEHARELLHEKNLLVTEVARSVGYKNPNHFSAAFKKKFGIKPSALR